MIRNSIWSNERTEIATWLSGYLNMIKTWVDKILDNEHYEVDKNKIIGLINEWIQWLEETKTKIMMMKDIDPTTNVINEYGDDDWASPKPKDDSTEKEDEVRKYKEEQSRGNDI